MSFPFRGGSAAEVETVRVLYIRLRGSTHGFPLGRNISRENDRVSLAVQVCRQPLVGVVVVLVINQRQ